jgi:membrane protein involved in colicin uptake
MSPRRAAPAATRANAKANAKAKANANANANANAKAKANPDQSTNVRNGPKAVSPSLRCVRACNENE